MEKVIQKNGMDDDLRNGLWNAFHEQIRRKMGPFSHDSEVRDLDNRIARGLLKKVVEDPFAALSRGEEKQYFFHCQWYEVYDFLEFVSKNVSSYYTEAFVESVNDVLVAENSAYRFVGDEIVPITDDNEIKSVDEALTCPISSARKNLEHALALFGDRKEPKYGKSVQCSISAVEAVCKSIAEDREATLGKALDKVDELLHLHPSFKKALGSLYGYTNKDGNIRHATLDTDRDVDSATAKFMLVTCSAFVNYIVAEAAAKGIELK